MTQMGKYIIKDDVNKTQGFPLCLYWRLLISSYENVYELSGVVPLSHGSYRTSVFTLFFPFRSVLQRRMSMFCATTNDAIIRSPTGQRICLLYAVLWLLWCYYNYYYITIKVLDSLMERCQQRVYSLRLCAGGGQFRWKSCSDLTYIMGAGSGLFTHRDKIYISCVLKTKPEAHTSAHTPTEAQLLKESHWFSCCHAGASITIRNHYCADHFV